MEEILHRTGGFGRYQFLLFNLLAFSSLKAMFDITSLVFHVYQPDFTCVPSINTSEFRNVSLRNVCTFSYINESNSKDVRVQQQCQKFVFDTNIMRRTLVTDYSLVCGKAFYQPLIQSIHFVGALIGMYLSSYGDRYGRRKVVLISAILDISTTVLITLMPDANSQTIARFLKGISSGIYYEGLSIVFELTISKYRAVVGNNFWLYWCGGYMLSAGCAFVTRDWKMMTYLSLASAIVYSAYFFCIPESPRWLYLKGRTAESHRVIKRIAKINNAKIEDDLFSNLPIERDEEAEDLGRFSDIITVPFLRTRALIMWYVLLSFSLCYLGLSLNATFADSDIFMNVFLSGLVEVPSSIIGWISSDKIGRVVSSGSMNIISGIFVIVVPFIPSTSSLVYVRTAFALFGKMLLTASYCIADLLTAEVFPTSHRNLGIFWGAIFACIGNIIAPYINTLSQYGKFIPVIIFGGGTIVCGCLIFMLPETRNRDLPDTIKEAKTLSKRKLETTSVELPKSISNCTVSKSTAV